MTEEEIVLVFFAFMVVFLTFPICKACTRPTTDLLDCNVGAQYFQVVVVYFRMWHFSQWMWWIEPTQNVHYDVVDGDVWHITAEILDLK